MKRQFMRTIKKISKKLIILFIIGLILAAMIPAGISLYGNWQVLKCSGKVYREANQLESGRIGLVLGTASKVSGGRRNLYFVYRMAAAAELYHAGKVKKLLVSGDHGQEGYDEPEDMRQALIALNVPDEDIIEDCAGFRTLDSVVRSKEVFKCEKVVIISQPQHCVRAVYLAEQIGLNAVGFAAQDVSVRRYRYKQHFREFMARVAAWIDIQIGREPRFYG